MRPIYQKILPVLCCLFIFTACQTVGSPWATSRIESNQPPENLLQQKQILSQKQDDHFWDSYLDNEQETTSDITVEKLVVNKNTSNTSPSLPFLSGNALETNNTTATSQDRLVLNNQTPTRPQPKIKAALLLPLSGQHEDLGQSILNAAQLALFDLASPAFELTPRDTRGTAEGAREAAFSAIQEGASVILGPLFADSVRAIKPITKRYGTPVLAFSTDWTVADYQTFLMGFMPFDQVERVMAYASSQGLKKQAIIAPYTQYGNAVTASFKQTARYVDADSVLVERYRSGDTNFNDLARQFTRYDERVETLQQAIAQIEVIPEKQRTDYQKNELARLEILHTAGDLPFDAILLPVGGSEVKSITSVLKYYDVDLTNARFLGTGLWDDPSISKEVSMIGGWYAAPSPIKRMEFEKQYRDVYGQTPPRLASLGFDATALVAVLSRHPNHLTPDQKLRISSLTDPNGFLGIDGIFRFRRNGLIERGLAVLEITSDGPKTVSPAPTTFQAQQF